MKSKKISENYLEKQPIRRKDIRWTADENGLVTLDIENKGILNRITQILIKKPKVSHIHLDEMGSFIWPLIDGEKSISDIGVPVQEHFGDKALPLYERLAQFFRILETNGFIRWNTPDKESANSESTTE